MPISVPAPASVAVSIDGRLHDAQTAVIPVYDRGFLYGDSVFESLRTAGGRPVDRDRHLERLARSAAALAFRPTSTELVAGELAATLAAAGHPDSYVRIMLTRGDGPIGLDPALATGAPRRVIVVQPLHLPAPETYARGLRVVVAKIERVSARALDPSVKSGNFLNGVLAVAEAKARGADDAILCNAAGDVAEGSASNVFVVREGRVRTPAAAAGLLEGITRRRALELLATAGVPVEQGRVTPDELRAADEIFLTSSIKGVMPVTVLDDRQVGADGGDRQVGADGGDRQVGADGGDRQVGADGAGGVGPVTRELMRRYADFLAEVAAGEARGI